MPLSLVAKVKPKKKKYIQLVSWTFVATHDKTKMKRKKKNKIKKKEEKKRHSSSVKNQATFFGGESPN